MEEERMMLCPQCNGFGMVADMDYTGRETLWACDMCNETGEVVDTNPKPMHTDSATNDQVVSGVAGTTEPLLAPQPKGPHSHDS